MFFLFGWGHRTTKEMGPTMAGSCGNCRNETWFHLFSYRTWITLFFIPVIPYESRTLLLCPVCTSGLELNGEQVEKAKRLNGLTTAFLAKEMAKAEYELAAREVQLLTG
jgi:hypothetical protein